MTFAKAAHGRAEKSIANVAPMTFSHWHASDVVRE